MEDYKAKFEKLIQRIDDLIVNRLIDEKAGKAILKDFAIESEDERIRKGLINLVKHNVVLYSGVILSTERVISWLEKQGEQKPTDKVEPKFNVGDWVVYKNDICQIVKREEGCNKLVTAFGIIKELVNERNLSTARLWTIQDAKDGDVLHKVGFSSDCIFIFNRIEDGRATAYCCIDVSSDKIEFGIQGPDNIEFNNITPATTVQRDLLFSKMKEAGYEWDADKKELRKIEQKPAWSKEDERKITGISMVLESWDSYHVSSAGLPSLIPEYISWLNALKERIQP